tara:strand:- start:171 stop:1166 length:996 start_codon:yes stop_codon:yes gene_type:complete
MAKQYGKNISLHKKENERPSSQVKGMNPKVLKKLNTILTNRGTLNNKGRKFNYQWLPVVNTATGALVDPSIRTQSFKDFPHFKNPFYNYLQTAAISILSTSQITNTTGTTSLNIKATGKDYLLRKGDKFYLFNNLTFDWMQLTCDADLMSSDTTLTITSTDFSSGNHFPVRSLIVADNQQAMETTSNAIQYKKYTLTNAEYKLLRTNGYNLLAAETGMLHLPISCYIQYKHGADEMARSSLYIGYNMPSTTIGTYWGSITDFAYRSRDSMLYQIGASTYSASLTSNDYKTTPLKSNDTDGTGEKLDLYTSINFTSASSYIVVHLYYKTIVG